MGFGQARSLAWASGPKPNRAVLHTDRALLPRDEKLWAAWNYAAGSGTPGVERDPDDEDPESDVPEGIPKVITSYVHLDVPYAFTRTWAGALKRAWRSVRPGDNQLVIGAQLNDVLAILVPVSQTVAPNSGQIAPPVPEQDEDPSQA